jgi:hypothetical protein
MVGTYETLDPTTHQVCGFPTHKCFETGKKLCFYIDIGEENIANQ